MDKITTYAELNFDLRQNKKTIDDIPTHLKSITLKEGYTIQDKLVAKLLVMYGGKTIGYKIGCTSKGAQELLNTDAPVYGRLFSAAHHQSPVTLDPAQFTMIVIEPEFAFTLSNDVPDGNYNAETIRPFVANIIPSIEIVHHRLGDWDKFDAPTVVADNSIHGAWVAGQATTDWHHLDLPNHEVNLFVNGTQVSSGMGKIALGNPLSALAWIANTLPTYGLSLKTGEIVTTGVCMPVYTAQPTEKITADFGTLGKVEITLLP